VNWRIFGRMAIAWVLTIPCAAGVAALAYWGTTNGGGCWAVGGYPMAPAPGASTPKATRPMMAAPRTTR
jgi:hypothetical protein